MSNWKLRYNDNTNWSSWYTIPSPTNELQVTMQSTRKKDNLYDGSQGRQQPSTKYNYAPITVKWDFISSSNVLILNTAANASSLSIESIVDSGYKIELATHTLNVSGGTNVSQTWQAYITEFDKNYLLGMYKASDVYETFYDLSADLDLISLV